MCLGIVGIMMEEKTANVEAEERQHDKIAKLIAKTGELLKKKSKISFEFNGRFLDVVWKDKENEGPSHVFEVLVSGDIDRDLMKLKHARLKFNAQPIYVVTTKENELKANRYLQGSLPEMKGIIKIMTREMFEKLYESLRTAIEILEKDLRTKMHTVLRQKAWEPDRE